jgi:hypothetical protein
VAHDFGTQVRGRTMPPLDGFLTGTGVLHRVSAFLARLGWSALTAHVTIAGVVFYEEGSKLGPISRVAIR